jgi:hypothetical protein
MRNKGKWRCTKVVKNAMIEEANNPKPKAAPINKKLNLMLISSRCDKLLNSISAMERII